MLNFFIGFAFFEAGAIFGFFVAALKQAQGANAIVDTMSATVIKKHNPGMSDTQLRQLITLIHDY